MHAQSIYAVFAKSAAIVSILLLGACKSDLTLTASDAFDVDWVSKTVTATIINQGSWDAGEFLVYLELSDPGAPESARPQSQGSSSTSGLVAGEIWVITINYTDFGIRGFDWLNSAEGLLEVRIDPKDMVNETDETNNYFSGIR